MEQKHSPLPLTQSGIFVLAEAGDYSIAKCNNEANAQFIVQACNSYDKDQETIKELLEVCKATNWWVKSKVLEAAIAKAEGR